MAVQAEHIFQKQLRQWIKDVVVDRHEFLSFDRAKATGKFTHMRERARGVRKGQADCMLRARLTGNVWIECKAPGKTPSESDPTFRDQIKFGEAMEAVGDYWFWANSIETVRTNLVALGVKMVPNAAYQAQAMDAKILSMIARERARKPSAAKKKAAPRYVATTAVAKRAKKKGIRI